MTRRNLIRSVSLMVLGSFAQAQGNIKLYLKDGTYQLVREYKVQGDKVSFYSVERSEWEDIPLALTDLKKTEAEVKAHIEERKAEAKALDEEEKAERAVAREVTRVPQEPGVYLISGEELKPIKQAEPKVVNNKGRHLLKLASPVPMVSDKSWLELDGPHSANVVADARPEFYFRLNAEERFGMVRMGEHKRNRVVEKLTIMPVVKEVVEEPQLVDTFRQQLGDLLYKIWPEKPLEPGEYAVIEYTEGKVNVQVWDFAYSPKS